MNRLTAEELFELRSAMERLQVDGSVDGYDAIAEYHGLPAKCPRPDAAAKDRQVIRTHCIAGFNMLDKNCFDHNVLS